MLGNLTGCEVYKIFAGHCKKNYNDKKGWRNETGDYKEGFKVSLLITYWLCLRDFYMAVYWKIYIHSDMCGHLLLPLLVMQSLEKHAFTQKSAKYHRYKRGLERIFNRNPIGQFFITFPRHLLGLEIFRQLEIFPLIYRETCPDKFSHEIKFTHLHSIWIHLPILSDIGHSDHVLSETSTISVIWTLWDTRQPDPSVASNNSDFVTSYHQCYTRVID